MQIWPESIHYFYMGRVKGNLVSGAVGSVVFYVVNGQQFNRAKPGKRKKPLTARMLERNNLFAELTGPSSRMLRYIKKQLLFPVGFNEYNRLRGWMYILYCANHAREEWPVMADNNMCQLNPAVDLRHFFTANITVSSKGSEGIAVNFPSFNPLSVVRAPLGAKDVTIQIIVVSGPTGTAPIRIVNESYSFTYTDTLLPAKEFVLNTKGDDKDLVIVVLAIEYDNPGQYTKPDPRWLPAAVIAMGRIKH